MGFWAKLLGRCVKQEAETDVKRTDQSFLTFQHTGEVIRAENLLQEQGFAVRVLAPPAWLRTGCDMVLVCAAVHEPAIRALLEKEQLAPEGVYPVADGLLAPVSLLRHVDYGDWFMVQAANMKITVERQSGRIVNVSGGGCPDVPYLAAKLVGTTLAEAEEPRFSAQTLCAYALQKAFMEAKKLWLQDRG
ncbi:MAG: DUF3343 domain-containing protein [Desulfovibrio sp.]|nr:DUF3343 domain-containing protein [Desulfovibrio sp.]